MEKIATYVLLFSIIVLLGQLFRKSIIPIPLILVLAGMLLSYVPYFPKVTLDPQLVLDVFLPLLVYEITAFSSWREIKREFRPISLLSIGHVVFITLLVAMFMRILIPGLSWPLAILLGAVVSPPDDVAIISIAEKIRLPRRVLIILEGEGVFNDAAALIIFRFALAAIFTANYSIINASLGFIAVIIGETLYGLVLGNVMGMLRSKIDNPMLHIIASILTPFFAYLPPVSLGGCGVLATAITGFIIGNFYALRFTPLFRTISRSLWPGLAFALEGLIFLLMGLDLRDIIFRMSSVPLSKLFIYALSITLLVIIGRFIWVFGFNILLPRALFPHIRKKDPYPPWQIPFLISWAGVRGGISLAAALSVPFLPPISGINPRDLIIFLVFCVIFVTLILQGLSLPWVIKKLGLDKVGRHEKYSEHIAELKARVQMTKAALRWLNEYKEQLTEHKTVTSEIRLQILQYKNLLKELENRLKDHSETPHHHSEKKEIRNETCLIAQIIEVEREELIKLWQEDKISLALRNKLIDRLDHQFQHLPS